MTTLNRIALVLVIIGAINWLLVGAFNYNLVTKLFGPGTLVTKVIYILIGLAGILAIGLLVGKKKASWWKW